MTDIDNCLLRDSLVTDSSVDQQSTEQDCAWIYAKEKPELVLNSDIHKRFLGTLLRGPLPASFKSLDASRPWLLYWTANGLSILKVEIATFAEGIAETALAFEAPGGGFGGGNRQLAHAAATYAAVNALALTGQAAAWQRINRAGCYSWMMSVKHSSGAFATSIGGEVDCRATYCILAAAGLLDLLTPELTANCIDYLVSTQTFEGGFANIPGDEAHGGYTFCSLASLFLLAPPAEVLQRINVPKLLQWLSRRQLDVEMGFSGRTNKLVDACYSHWVGGCWSLVMAALPSVNHSLWNRHGLVKYLLQCSQEPRGGFRDKPGANADPYHTNYSLCGLSHSQFDAKYDHDAASRAELGDFSFLWTYEQSSENTVPGLEPLNPVHVLPAGVAEKMRSHFHEL